MIDNSRHLNKTPKLFQGNFFIFKKVTKKLPKKLPCQNSLTIGINLFIIFKI